jgi:hypothetical protein
MTIVVEFRYHIGRHVANLQVTNTYEGQSSCSIQLESMIKPLSDIPGTNVSTSY